VEGTVITSWILEVCKIGKYHKCIVSVSLSLRASWRWIL